MPVTCISLNKNAVVGLGAGRWEFIAAIFSALYRSTRSWIEGGVIGTGLDLEYLGLLGGIGLRNGSRSCAETLTLAPTRSAQSSAILVIVYRMMCL